MVFDGSALPPIAGWGAVSSMATGFSVMNLINQIVLLFGLNLLDGLLTVFWVRTGVATESNRMMAELLNVGNFPFLGVKIAIGAIAAIVLLRFSHKPVARYGLTISLAIYLGLMFLHVFTGLTAFGFISSNFLQNLGELPGQLFALVT